MWKRIPAIKSFSAIGVAILNIVSWIPPVQDWFSQNVPSFDIRWINLVFILILLGVIYWIVHGLYQEVEELENKKPAIKVTRQRLGDNFYLNVSNFGEMGKFKSFVTFYTVYPRDTDYRKTINNRSQSYNAIWCDSSKNTTEILKGQNDAIRIASIIKTKDGKGKNIVLYAYDEINNHQFTMPSNSQLEYLSKNTLCPEYNLKVNISSDPSLKKGAFVKNYILNLNGMKESKIQPIPDFHVELIEERYFETEEEFQKELNKEIDDNGL